MHGGRWNSAGRRVVYTSQSLALAALEMLVHIPADLAPADLVALTIEIPDDLFVDVFESATLPGDWNNYADSEECRLVGDAWVAAGSAAVLQVPAAPVPQEHNFLISVAHPGAHRIGVVNQRSFRFDPRLVK